MVWRHTSEDAVAAEITEMSVVRSYRWSSVNGEYSKEEIDVDSDDFVRKDYRFVGFAQLSK